MAGSMTAVGGVSGFMLSGSLQQWQPFLMAVAGSSFIFVALSDLIPQLQQRRSTRETTTQVVWLLVGILLVVLVNGISHERVS
jgi:zinc and cadmium transporter